VQPGSSLLLLLLLRMVMMTCVSWCVLSARHRIAAPATACQK
jgi:hypothetical protein